MNLIRPSVFLREGINAEKMLLDGRDVIGRFTVQTVAAGTGLRRTPTLLIAKGSCPDPMDKILIRKCGTYKIREHIEAGEGQFWLCRMTKL